MTDPKTYLAEDASTLPGRHGGNKQDRRARADREAHVHGRPQMITANGMDDGGTAAGKCLWEWQMKG